MKKALIISLLSFITSYGFAQSADAPTRINKVQCMSDPDMPANAVLVWPESAYTPVADESRSCPPCYEYKDKRGHSIMECPFAIFSSQTKGDLLNGTPAVTTISEVNGEINVQTVNTYIGNYPACSKNLYPPHSTPVWPKSAYTPTGNPNCAPCYEYTSWKGTAVMERPYLVFPSEGSK